MNVEGLEAGFVTVAGTILLAELTDKDALLLLSLATKMRPLLVFGAGTVAFTATSAVIVAFGSVLVQYVPIFLVKIAGGAIMLGYAALELVRGARQEESVKKDDERLRSGRGHGELYTFLSVIASLILLDLAGDATELLTIVFVAQYQNALLVFAGAVSALVVASAVETALGNQLGRALSSKSIRRFSVLIFLVIGTLVIISTVIPSV